mgnify:CR=1 FL=1
MDGAVVSDATASHCVNDQTSSEIELQRLRNELEAQRRSSEAVDVLAAELEEKKLEANQLRAALAREAEAHRTLRGQLASFQTVVKEASDGLGVVELVSTLQRRTETSERLCDQLTLEISRLNGLVAERTAQCDGLVDTAERLQQQWRRQEEVHLEEVEMFRSKAATSDNAVTTLSSEVGRLNEQSLSLGYELSAALRRLGS